MKTPETFIDRLLSHGINNSRVLDAMRKIPRDFFVDEAFRAQAYQDIPLPIACHQTISQPYIVARMTSLLIDHCSGKKILEIGTGSGYQAAVLSQCVTTVYTLEHLLELHRIAIQRFTTLHLSNIVALHRNGYEGYPEQAPYDGIMVTAAAPEVPPALLAQLANHGCLVMPVGKPDFQRLHLVIRKNDTYETLIADAVTFVPLLNS